MSTSPTRLKIILAGAITAASLGPALAQSAGAPLGRIWQEQEAGWNGRWTRVGNSPQFRAEWTHPSGRVVRADLTITLQGNRISVARRDTFGPGVGRGCRYWGTLNGSTASGQYTCDWDRGSPGSWSARIQ